MRRNWLKGRLGIAAAMILVLMFAAGCSNNAPDNSENEINIQIKLDLSEDIGLFLIDTDINGIKTSGGSSNADKTMLKKDELLFWSIDKQFYENIPDTVELSLVFRVVTEYCDPNYENTYPEEYVIPLEGITFTASFGETYYFKVTGDNINGYQAVME